MNDAIELNLQIDGLKSGPTVVFLNSLGTNLHLWDQQVQQLGQHFRLVRLDTRGHGQSPAPAGPYTLEVLCADVVLTLNRAGINRAVVCGISMGGLMALYLAIHHTDRVQSVLAANTAAKIGQQQAWQERASLVQNLGMGPVVQSAASRWFTENWANKRTPLVEDTLAQLQGTSATGYAACCEALAVADLRSHVSQIRLPVCVVAGEFDPVTTVDDARFLVSEIGGSDLCVLPASHLSNVECADQFSEVLRSFAQRSTG